MLIQKNETAIQVLKILYSQNKKKSKKIKKTHYNTVYPRAIEAKYKTKLSSYFQPLIDYVNKFLEENEDALLRGDSMQLKLDVLPRGQLEKVNDVINPILDDADYISEQYFLEVSSSGLERKLRKKEQFEKQIGNKIEVKLYQKIENHALLKYILSN